MPVPPYAPKPTFNHFHRRHEDIIHTATYRVDGHVLGYVVRFRTSDGGKVSIPYTWGVSETNGSAKWVWKFWEPRPLFYPGGQHPGDRTVIVVEGEIKAEVLQALLDAGAPGVYCVVGWPGGCKGWHTAMWEWIAGCTVLLWADCDSKREQLSKTELASLNQAADTTTPEGAEALRATIALAASTKPYLPADKQPGKAAMLGIGALLRDTHSCSVSLLPCEEPGVLPDGWDARDAIEADGWDFTRVLEFFARASTLPVEILQEKSAKRGKAEASEKKTEASAEEKSGYDGDDAFEEHLEFMCDQLGCKRHDLGVTRKLIIAALRKAPGLKDCVGFDQLRGAPCTRVAWPWRDAAGPLEESDDLRLGDYLSGKYKLKAASRAALTEAISTVADEVRFHPVRDWLNSLEHDKVPRLDKWLIHVLGMDPARLKPRRRRYLELMGRFLLMGLVARVFEPGIKFDYSPVFEGIGGVGKSTFVEVLVGKEFFSDTHFDIGNGKDGMEQLEGLWAYELSEMTAFRRADNEQVKAFFSSRVDRFRGAYGKYVQPHPRQCVIFCTTNKRQYLYDLTGNRRFWPVWISQPILLDWLKKYRHLLFAEAVIVYKKGDRYHPTREEEDQFFVPEQMKRLAGTSVQSRLWELLTREGAAPSEGRAAVELTQLTKFVTLHQLVAVLGSDAAKSTAALENQVRSWLEFQGWKYGREGGGQRRWGFKAPKQWPPAVSEDSEEDEEEEAERRSQLEALEDGVPPAQGDAHGGGDDEPF